MSEQRHAEIAGAGIAGLSAAVFLARVGWSVAVHEQAPVVSDLGAGLLLKPNSTQKLTEAGVASRFPNAPAIVDGYECRNGDGKIISSYTHTGKLAAICPLRQEVVTALRDTAIDAGVKIHTGSRMIAADPDGILRGDDGRSYPADLVVAADGWKSTVRDSVAPAVIARQLTHGATRTVIPRLGHETVSILQEYWSGARRVGFTPVSPSLLYVFLSAPGSDERGRAVEPIDVDAWSSSFPCLEPSILERLSRATAVHHSYCYVRTEVWHRGRVAILGDAANAMPPTLAQGAGLAIMNAAGLALELGSQSDVSAALVSWQRKYRPITVSTQDWAMRYLRVANSWLTRRAGLQGYVLAMSRVPALNRRMRIADRVTIGHAGPVEIRA